jgi:hypothetical protein
METTYTVQCHHCSQAYSAHNSRHSAERAKTDLESYGVGHQIEIVRKPTPTLDVIDKVDLFGRLLEWSNQKR